ncbi:hypothetical protein BH11PSE10_BH11PSE10_19540 [soil metagenome]
MNPTTITPLHSVPVDDDLTEQAHAGQGVPSQDPAAAAQFPLSPEEAKREGKSVLAGGGMVAGAATGATLGVVVAGPVGVVVGGAVGAVVGVLGAVAAGAMLTPEEVSTADKAHAQTVRTPTEHSADSEQPNT